MKFKASKILFSIITLLIVVTFTGCAHMVMPKPEAKTEGQEPQLNLPETKRIPAKVGYI